MGTALDRLSKIKDEDSFRKWFFTPMGYDDVGKDIMEVVALAKQQPGIDAMRFEAAKAAMQADMSRAVFTPDDAEIASIKWVTFADALIAEVQKPKP